MVTRIIASLVVTLAVIPVVSGAIQADAAESVDSGDALQVDRPDFKEMLEVGLRARRPQEFAFIARVVNMVEDNTLPLPLVQSTFQWARRRLPNPFPYFEQGLRVRARRIGIAL